MTNLIYTLAFTHTHKTSDGIAYLNETVFVDYDIQSQLAGGGASGGW